MRSRWIWIGTAAALLLTVGRLGWAQTPPEPPPPAPPTTLWNFLGIPQGVNRLRDHRVNKNGNHPERERKPLLKRIADPENLKSKNPAIQAAAKIKQEEDLARQKIKAIKYLATIGCGCYPKVKEALVAALDDCTEEVRYEACLAIWRATCNHCAHCDRNCCCDQEVVQKLTEIVYGRGEDGCFLEPSERVREAAHGAMCACCRYGHFEPVAPPESQPPREVPVPTQEKETPSGTTPPPPAPPVKEAAEAEADALHPIPLSNAGNLPAESAETSTDVVLLPDEAAQAGSETLSAEELLALIDRTPRPLPSSGLNEAVAATPPCVTAAPSACPQGAGSPHPAPTPATAPGEAAGDVAPGMLPGSAQASDMDSPPSSRSDGLFSSLGGAAGPQSAAPYMIGDVFGSGSLIVGTYDGQFGSNVAVRIPGGGLGGAPGANVGRMKLTEGTSPLPRDRVFFNYSFFDNTPLDVGGVNVHRLTPGFEKTFFDERASFELRAPFASTLDSTVISGGNTDDSQAEFGNLTMYVKGRVWSNETLALSGGVGLAVPTADDFLVQDRAGNTLVEVQNEAVHVLPFVGFVGTPNDRWFYQGLLQFDVDANGNPVFADGIEVARPSDTDLVFLDLNLGYWLYRDEMSTGWITGIAPMVELHYNASIQEGDGVSSSLLNAAAPDRINLLNGVVGVTAVFDNQAALTLGYATPLGTDDQQFDGEFRMICTWYFGHGAGLPMLRP